MISMEGTLMQTVARGSESSGLVAIILTGVIAFSTLMSWIAVLQANRREKRRIEREENPQLHVVGSAHVKASSSGNCTVDLFINNPGRLSINLLDINIESPRACPQHSSKGLKWLWNIVFPLVDTQLLEKAKPLPGPVLSGGVTKVRCGCDFRIGSIPETINELNEAQLAVRMRTMAAGYEAMEYELQIPITAKRA
jgi:hypothetical protein